MDTPRQLVDTAQALLAPHRPRGRRIAVVGDGGGYGAIASDLLGERGIETRQAVESERRAFCVFEHIYFARPDSKLEGRRAQVSRARSVPCG